jgi:nitrite reductase/ring-hydroxylating ferredoxin subunit
MRNKNTISLLIILLLIVTSFKQCKEHENPVPITNVNITIDLNDANYNDFVPGSYKYITGGVSGIVLYRKNFNEFSALERTCPYEADYGTRVTVDTDNDLFLLCDSCESRFYIEDGSLLGGPSEYPLRTYKTSYDGRFLYIYN